MSDLPLAGLRVLDFGQGAAGPYCAQLLGDHGADVVKVEPPRGDWGRALGTVDPVSGLSSTYLAVNRNKRGLCLDLADEADLATVRRLALAADVLVESFRPGVMDRLGLGADELRGGNPKLVYCSVTGFGADGPRAALPASDSMMQAYGGLMSVIGEPEGPPLRVGNVVSDMLAGTNAFAGVVLALLRRGVTNQGGRVEVSLLDSLVAFQATGLTEFLVTGNVPAPPGNRHPLIGASGVTRAGDGYLAVGVLDHCWDVFCDVTGFRSDDRFATAANRVRHQQELWELLDGMFAERTVQEWCDLLTPVGVVAGPVHDYADLAADPQVRHNELFQRRDGLPMVRNPMRLDDVEPGYGRPPRLGEHNEEIATLWTGPAR